MLEKEINPGTSFIDLSTLYSVQKIIDTSNNISEYQVIDLCSFLDCLTLSNKLAVIKPLEEFESVIPVQLPPLLDELTSKGIKIMEIPYYEEHKIEDILLSYASDIGQQEEQVKFLKRYGKTFDISGYYKNYFKDESNKQLIKKLDKKGFSLSDGSLIGLCHHYRCCSYLQLSNNQGLPYFSHVIREPMIRRAVEAGCKNASRLLLSKVFIDRIEKKIDAKLDDVRQLINVQKTDIRLPAIPSLILSQCNDVTDIFDEAIIFYKQKDAIQYRNFMEKYEAALLKEDLIECEKYEYMVNDVMESLEQKMFDGVELLKTSMIILEYINLCKISKNPIDLGYAIMKFVYESITHSGELEKLKNRRQLSFLGKIAKNYKEIQYSKDQFEKVLDIDIDLKKIYDLKNIISG